jgi:phage-related protein
MADPLPQPYWPWCAQPGAARTSTLVVDEVAYGDGYKHRATRGLNPVRPEWSLGFPFTSLAELDERDAFLRRYAAGGFWFTPPDGATPLFVTANEWSASITERNLKTGIVGVLTVTMAQCFNPQFPGTPR